VDQQAMALGRASFSAVMCEAGHLSAAALDRCSL
jgi:hypothetical protein